MSNVILQAQGVTKRFGNLVAVNSVDFTVKEFEVVGILGSNGAGKTTFFNLLTGLFFPDEGVITYRGVDITKMSAQDRVEKGLTRTFQLTSTFDNLTVTDNLLLVYFRKNHASSIKDLLLTTRKSHYQNPKILDILATFNLEDVKDKLVQHLSLGEKRRLEIAMAVLAEPRVLLLDEPLAGLAESEIKGVLDVLRQHIGGARRQLGVGPGHGELLVDPQQLLQQVRLPVHEVQVRREAHLQHGQGERRHHHALLGSRTG